jgi:hypothetical protein
MAIMRAIWPSKTRAIRRHVTAGAWGRTAGGDRDVDSLLAYDKIAA